MREPFRSESSGREGRRHAEEENSSFGLRAQDARGLSARSVGHVDDEVRHVSPRSFLHLSKNRYGVPGVERPHLVSEGKPAGSLGGALRRVEREDEACLADSFTRSRKAQQSRLPGSDDDDSLSGFRLGFDARGSTRDVECRQRHFFRQVVR